MGAGHLLLAQPQGLLNESSLFTEASAIIITSFKLLPPVYIETFIFLLALQPERINKSDWIILHIGV